MCAGWLPKNLTDSYKFMVRDIISYLRHISPIERTSFHKIRNLLKQRNSKQHHEGEGSRKTPFCIIKLSVLWSFLTVVQFDQLSVIMVHFWGFGRPIVSKHLVCCCRASSFFMVKPGSMDYPPYSPDFAVSHFCFWTT
jgi:hypothetical protein